MAQVYITRGASQHTNALHLHLLLFVAASFPKGNYGASVYTVQPQQMEGPAFQCLSNESPTLSCLTSKLEVAGRDFSTG